MNKIKLFFKATKSRLFNHMADYEDAYEEGWAHGQEEGFSEGFSSKKKEEKEIWGYLYQFLQDRQRIDRGEEVTTLDLIERLIDYERDFKLTKDEQRANTQYWRDDAFEVAAKIVDNYVRSFGYEPQIANDIRALKKNLNVSNGGFEKL